MKHLYTRGIIKLEVDEDFTKKCICGLCKEFSLSLKIVNEGSIPIPLFEHNLFNLTLKLNKREHLFVCKKCLKETLKRNALVNIN